MSEFTFIHPEDGSTLHFDTLDAAISRAESLADWHSCNIVICENGQPIEPIIEGTKLHTFIGFIDGFPYEYDYEEELFEYEESFWDEDDYYDDYFWGDDDPVGDSYLDTDDYGY